MDAIIYFIVPFLKGVISIKFSLYKILTKIGKCISQYSALCLLPGPQPWPQSLFTSPGTQFVFTGPGPHNIFTSSSVQFVFNIGPKFAFTGPSLQYYYQSRASVLHILTLSTKFVFVFIALAYNLCYWSGAWICIFLIVGSRSSGTFNSSISNFFEIDNSNISMPILVN